MICRGPNEVKWRCAWTFVTQGKENSARSGLRGTHKKGIISRIRGNHVFT